MTPKVSVITVRISATPSYHIYRVDTDISTKEDCLGFALGYTPSESSLERNLGKIGAQLVTEALYISGVGDVSISPRELRVIAAATDNWVNIDIGIIKIFKKVFGDIIVYGK